ncbi:aldo/keto reductase [Paracidobacterium acidisoli]|uniref:aldo/keto reductase n=1 Tax=Paracidobacterium acidisoli TaxID=2303751 RepID=UPI001C0311DF|nr:aldo/keto reductase [Paracidobacterium acidisoli]
MKRVRLGQSNVTVSSLALGTDLIGSKIDRDQSFALFDFYRERGGNFLDTANFYASWYPGCKGGESETTIGQWMKERRNRDEVVVSTKLAFDYPGSPGGLRATEIQRECEMSLKRLQTDRVDLYQAHRDDRDTPLEETMEAFDRLIQAGKVRALGASNLALWRIAEANLTAGMHGWTPYSVVEQRYTYLRPRHGADFGPQIFIDDDLKDYATHHEITLVGYSILLQGAYTRADREIPAQFAGPDSVERLEVLRAVSNEAGCDPTQTIIAWMRQSKPSVLPIIAGSRTEQLQENIAALEVTLTEDQMQRLDTAGNPSIRKAWIQPT